jgi:hypothetical protein
LIPGVPLTPTPEPGSLVLALCGLGVVGLVGTYRSRRRSTVDA